MGEAVRREPWRWRAGRVAGVALAATLVWLSLACSAPAAVPAPAPTAAPASAATTSREAARPLRKLHFSYATEASLTAPIWVAKDQGLFEKYGLDVELSFIRGGATVVQSMVAGSVDLALSGASATITANLGGADVRFLATTSIVADQALISKPSISSPTQLRGKLIGASLSGGSGLPQLLEALRRVGLTADDVQMIDVPAGSDRMAGLSSGALDAIMVAPAQTDQMKALGFYVLMDLVKEGVPNQGQSIIALQPFVEQNPEVVRGIIQAFCEAIHVLLTDKSTTERSIGKWARIDDPAELESAYYAIADPLQKKPYPSLPAIQLAIDAVALRVPEARQLTPERLVNDTILRQLDNEGFIDALWR